MENIFFIIGAQRAGTTWLTAQLARHHDIAMAQPLFPEPKFFLSDEEVKKGKAHYLNRFFSCAGDPQWLGEKSTSYIESEKAARNIKAIFPEARIIAVLRNPVERALSNYYFSKSHGVETRTLREAFIGNKKLTADLTRYSVSPLDYIKRGEYATHLKRYFNLFSKEKVLVLIFEKMICEPKEQEKVFDFLSLKKDIAFSDMKINGTGREEGRDTPVIDFLKDHYQKYNLELEQLLETDLNIWK